MTKAAAVVLLLLVVAVSATVGVATVGTQDFYDVCDQVNGALSYPCEHRTTRTADGFLLDVIRIPPKTRGAPPVILQHGLLDSAITWVANYFPHQNLGCILHDLGYDVWMPNSRGNHYSMNNTNYAPYTSRQPDTAYWESIDCDQMGQYDVPANIDYVLNVTGASTVTFIGHSQGTYQMFAAMSKWNPSYAKKINVFIGLAPVAFVGSTTSLLLKIIAGLKVGDIIALFGGKEFLVNDWLIREISKICPALGKTCGSLLEIFCGDGNPANTNSSQIPTILRYDPGGTSVNNMIHWQQNVNRNDFAAHDYGSSANMQKYGQSTPPVYNLSNFVAPPTALFAGDRDALADPADVERLIAAMPPRVLVNVTYLDDFAHLDFTWGLDAYRVLYPSVVALVQQYNPLP